MSSSTFFHKPELALRRALELQGIDQDEAALELLHEVISSRRQRTWSPAFEQIMMAYLKLCLKLLRSREAKDGLHQYRNLSQSQAPGSLEKVIRYLMEAAEQQCRAAKALVDASGSSSAAAAADDDDFGASPQSILLSTMYMDPGKSQRDSAMLLPSLKFLWETYRAVLDILRSNSKLEHVYHAAAQAALRFCRTYKRRMEFRHLTDMLRTHLGNLRQFGNLFESSSAATDDNAKTSNKVRGWDGWTAESIEMHLQTRFAQLETASVLHRYTEGFRTCEDIFHILQVSHARRKIDPTAAPPKAKLMASYYEKLTTLFWVSENYLFHAYAWYKYYSLCCDYNRAMSEETKRLLASAVLLAALCIPSLPQQSGAATEKQHGITSTVEDDIVKQKMARMSTLLGFATRHPTREALLHEIRSKDLLNQVPEYLRQLYFLLEENSDPLIMVSQAQPLLVKLQQEIGKMTSSDEENEDVQDNTLGRYVQPLTSVLLLKLIVNLSKAYHTVSMDFLKSLTADLFMSFDKVEKALVLFTQTKALSVRIDHRAGCLRFGNVQLESDTMRSQLTVLSKQLQAVSHILKKPRPEEQQAVATRRATRYQEIRQGLNAEHAKIIARKNLIEQRKELEERLAQDKVQQEERRKAEEAAKRRKEEEIRKERERLDREREKQLQIQQELKVKENKQYLKAIGENVEELSEAQIAAMKTEELERKHQAEVQKKKDKAERETKEAAKKLDYLVRAIRIEELPLIKERYQAKVKQDRERYEQETVEKAKTLKEKWEQDVKAKSALDEHGVFGYMAQFESSVMVGRKVAHRELCHQADAAAEIEAEKGKLKRARQRRVDEQKRQAEAEQRAAEEAEREKAAEQERLKEEARQARQAKEQATREAENRRMVEEEERRRAAEQQQQRGSGRYVPPSKRSAAGSGGGGGGGGSRFGGESFPGGGRYGGPGDDRRGGGGAGDRRGFGGGDRRGFDDRDRRGGFDDRDRRGGGFDDRGGGDRRGFGGDRDRGGGGGGFGGDRPRGDDRGFGDRRGGGGGGYGGGDRMGGGGGPRPSGGDGGGRWRK